MRMMTATQPARFFKGGVIGDTPCGVITESGFRAGEIGVVEQAGEWSAVYVCGGSGATEFGKS